MQVVVYSPHSQSYKNSYRPGKLTVYASKHLAKDLAKKNYLISL